jgi:hypothetical protein
VKGWKKGRTFVLSQVRSTLFGGQLFQEISGSQQRTPKGFARRTHYTLGESLFFPILAGANLALAKVF